jgi:hypothetical protein
MRFQEINNYNMPINNDEYRFLENIKKSGNDFIEAVKLSENEIELARKMVTRGLIGRAHIEDETFYVIPSDLKFED